MNDIEVLEGAEEFSLGDGPVGALLVHGFTGSPQGMRALGEYLAERGVAVAAPRLPGHGTTWQDLNARTADDWVDSVEDAFENLADGRDEVFLVGLSFGAALVLDLAARRPDRVAGVVTLAGFLHTKDPRRFLAPVVRLLVQSLPGVGNDIADPEMREIVYDRVPTRATYWMLRFVRRVRGELHRVRAPLLVMHSRNDHTADPSNADLIYNGVSSEDKDIVWFDRSYHVITVDFDRDDVYERTYRFIKEHSNHGL